MRFATFIVPTLGRDTLERTLRSLSAQTEPSWQALVIADCVENFAPPRIDDRIYFVNLKTRHGGGNQSGLVRNHGLTNAAGQWLCFVDDDDSLDPHYLEWLKEEGPEKDIVVFRMRCGPGGFILPPNNELHSGSVGISFAIRRSFQKEKDVWFPNNPQEDWIVLSNAIGAGARVKVSERVAYLVRHGNEG